MRRICVVIVFVLIFPLHANAELLRNPSLDWAYIYHPGYGYTAEYWVPWGSGEFDWDIYDLLNFTSQKIQHSGYGFGSFGPCGIYQTIDGLEPGTVYRVSGFFDNNGYLYSDQDENLYVTYSSISQIGVDPNAGIDPYQTPRWSPIRGIWHDTLTNYGNYYYTAWSQENVYFKATQSAATIFTQQFGIVEGESYFGPVDWQINCYIDNLSVTPIQIGFQSTVEAVGPVQADGFDLCEVIVTIIDDDGVPLPGIQIEDVRIECSGTGNQIIYYDNLVTDYNGRLILWISSTTPEVKTIQAWVFDTPLPEVQVQFGHPRGWQQYQKISLPGYYYSSESSVALSRDRAIIGCPDDMLGSAEIYQFDGGAWQQEAILRPSESLDLPFFGASVDLDGSFAIVSNTDYYGYGDGCAYIYEYDGANWNQQIKLTNTSLYSHTDYARTVKLNGNWAMISAPGEYPNGCIYVYLHEDGQWQQHSTLTDPNESYFGFSFSLSDQWVSIVAVDAVILYKQQNDGWQYHTKLTPSESEDIMHFGQDICLDGNRLYVNASYDSVPQELILEYYYDGNQWVLQNKYEWPIGNISGWNDHYFSFFGNWGISGVPAQDYGNYLWRDEGLTIFYRDQNSWIPTARLYAPTFEPSLFGESLAMNDEWILISSPLERAYYFVRRYYRTGDINRDDHVNTLDFAALAGGWNQPDFQEADIDRSGSVDYGDLWELSWQWLWSVKP